MSRAEDSVSMFSRMFTGMKLEVNVEETEEQWKRVCDEVEAGTF